MRILAEERESFLIKIIGTIVVLLLGLYFLNVKASAATNLIIQRTAHPVGNFRSYDIEETSDGGYITTGFAYGDFYRRAVVVKYNSSHDVEWMNDYTPQMPTIFRTEARSIKETQDGGFIVAGNTTSNTNNSNMDIFLMKLAPNGSVQWANKLTGTGEDTSQDILITSDGGYLVLANTRSFGSGLTDLILFKYDASGNLVWSKTYGNNFNDEGYKIIQTIDGGYAIAGYTELNISTGNSDLMLLKLDNTGAISWSKRVGGNLGEIGFALAESSTGELIIAGRASGEIYTAKFSSTGTFISSKSYGGGTSTDDGVFSVKRTSDGGFIVAGYTQTFGSNLGGIQNILIFKINSSGTVQWSKVIGEIWGDVGTDIEETSDGGYLATGYIHPGNGELNKSYQIKLDENGNIDDCPFCSSVNLVTTTASFAINTPVLSSLSISPIISSVTVNTTPRTPNITIICDNPNTAPIADAGDDQSTLVNIQVTLDGSGSSDPDGDSLTYLWTQEPGNPQTVSLSNAASVQPTFTASIPGTYIFKLVVNDGSLNSTPDYVTITVTSSLDAIDDLIAYVQSLNIPGGNGMIAKLNSAINKLTDNNSGNDSAAVASILSFIDQVEDKRGISITDEQADYMVGQAQLIIQSLGN